MNRHERWVLAVSIMEDAQQELSVAAAVRSARSILEASGAAPRQRSAVDGGAISGAVQCAYRGLRDHRGRILLCRQRVNLGWYGIAYAAATLAAPGAEAFVEDAVVDDSDLRVEVDAVDLVTLSAQRLGQDAPRHISQGRRVALMEMAVKIGRRREKRGDFDAAEDAQEAAIRLLGGRIENGSEEHMLRIVNRNLRWARDTRFAEAARNEEVTDEVEGPHPVDDRLTPHRLGGWLVERREEIELEAHRFCGGTVLRLVLGGLGVVIDDLTSDHSPEVPVTGKNPCPFNPYVTRYVIEHPEKFQLRDPQGGSVPRAGRCLLTAVRAVYLRHEGLDEEPDGADDDEGEELT